MSWNPVLRKSRNPSFRCWEILEMTPVAQESRNTLFHNSGFRRGIHGGNFCIGGGQRSHAKGSVKFWRRALPLTPVRLLRVIHTTYYESDECISKILLGREQLMTLVSLSFDEALISFQPFFHVCIPIPSNIFNTYFFIISKVNLSSLLFPRLLLMAGCGYICGSRKEDKGGYS